jgi:hypothetical protein
VELCSLSSTLPFLPLLPLPALSLPLHALSPKFLKIGLFTVGMADIYANAANKQVTLPKAIKNRRKLNGESLSSSLSLSFLLSLRSPPPLSF